MENKSAGGPVVRISHDQMEAYLLLPMVNFDQTYKFEEVMDLLDKNGVASLDLVLLAACFNHCKHESYR